jgi:predicted metalloprotease with PDZ domain
LLPLPTYEYFVGQFPVFSGIEGIQGYWFMSNLYSWPQVHTHELIHTFVGIYHGDLEDPWWKEGLTNYLGLLLPLQAGMINDSVFAAAALADLTGKAATHDLPLSSPALRTRLFIPLDSAWNDPQDSLGFPELVYGKGAQASMILDRWILERSGGRKSIYDLVRALVRLPDPGFTRSQLVAATESVAGAPAEGFLASLLDRPGAFPADSLRATYLALKAMGRFAPGGGKLPVPGIDPPAARIGSPSAKSGSRAVTGKLPMGAKL